MHSFTIKSLLVPLLTRPRVAQVVKWTVYLALIVNTGVYFYDDWMVYKSVLAPGAPWADTFEQFATTIDMFAWLGLVFLFELETYALPDEAFKEWVTKSIHVVRLACYLGIAYAAYGYTINTLDYYNYDEVSGLTDLCQIADQGRSLQLDVVTYEPITAENCANFSAAAPYFEFVGELSVIDTPGLDHSRALGGVDIANAFVWLIVVFLIEIEVRMQAADRFGGGALKPVRILKTIFYGELIINAIIWIATGYPMYAWDAFLWIFGFWAIELNLAEWEQERTQELATVAI
jgi:hypothetical protein